MAKLFIKGSYTRFGEITAFKDCFSFKVNNPDHPSVIINVYPKEQRIESFQEVEVSVGLWDRLKENTTTQLPTQLQSEITNVCSYISNSTRRVLNLIKYCFNQTDVQDTSLASNGMFWSSDQLNWDIIPQTLTISHSLRGLIPLREDSCTWLQSFLDSNYEPFLALRYLHRARNESNPQFKWIDATIAAELAIKEFLIRRKPELEVLLLEVPSPPMRTMYGMILDHYGETVLPKDILGALENGAKIRNRLLHRPKEEIIEDQKALDYVNSVSQAIRHLVLILEPGIHIEVC